MITAVAMLALCLILGKDCSLWMSKKHPRVMTLMYWLLLPLAAIGSVAGVLLSNLLIGTRPFGMMNLTFPEAFLTFVLFASALLFPVLLGLLLRLIVLILWHPSAQTRREIEAFQAEDAAAVAKRQRKREMKHWICPDCGTENNVMREYCTRCNHRWAEY